MSSNTLGFELSSPDVYTELVPRLTVVLYSEFLSVIPHKAVCYEIHVCTASMPTSSAMFGWSSAD